MSAKKAAKGSAHPLAPDEKPIPIDDELLLAHQETIAHRKLTRIMRSYSLKISDFKPGDFLQIYIHLSHEKNGKRSEWYL